MSAYREYQELLRPTHQQNGRAFERLGTLLVLMAVLGCAVVGAFAVGVVVGRAMGN